MCILTCGLQVTLGHRSRSSVPMAFTATMSDGCLRVYSSSAIYACVQATALRVLHSSASDDSGMR